MITSKSSAGDRQHTKTHRNVSCIRPVSHAFSIWNDNSVLHVYYRSRDSAVGIATGYGLDDRGVAVRVPVGSRMFSSPRRPDRLWGPPSLLSVSGALSPGGKSGRGMKLTTHLQLVPRSTKCGSIHQFHAYAFIG
jgi:hypothetical protein